MNNAQRDVLRKKRVMEHAQQIGNVRMISGGNSDRLFFLVNAVVLIGAAVIAGRRIKPSRSSSEASG